MRSFLLSLAVFSTIAITPAFALQADDTMQAWKGASDRERADLLKQLLGDQSSGNPRLSRCMTETSATPGHANLPIGEVAKACASAGKSEQPV